MNIDFGIVKKYFSDRGFGFVTHTFLLTGRQPEVFFHIKSIKRMRPDLAEKLGNEECKDTICFWYETEYTSKGEQVCNALRLDAIQSMDTDDLSSYVDKIENIWTNIDSTTPVWLRDATVDLVGVERASELSLERNTLKRERTELEEKRRKEREALRKIEEAKREKERKIEEAKRQKRIEEKNIQEEIEKKEFELLVAEMEPLGFTHSKEVSWYIMNNRLGYKYKNISGIVEMERDGRSWDFKGGFPPMIYAKLCEELGLSSQFTRAKAVKFTSFNDL